MNPQLPPPGAQLPPPGTGLVPKILNPAQLRLLQRSVDRFTSYWQSRETHEQWMVDDAAGLRAPIYEKFQVPLPYDARIWPLTPNGALLDRNEPRWRINPASAGRNEEFMTRIEAGEYGLVSLMQPVGLELKRILGVGGQGVACLFQRTEADGSKRDVVVKASINTAGVERETRNLALMAGANHIVQRLFERDLAAPPAAAAPVPAVAGPAAPRAGPAASGGPPAVSGDTQPNSNPLRRKRLATDPPADEDEENRPPKRQRRGAVAVPSVERGPIDSSEQVFTMEFMKNGDIRNMIGKMEQWKKMVAPNRVAFKDRELWEIFHCLFRGVVAMAYPGVWARGKDPSREDVVQQFENIPRFMNGAFLNPENGIIHFDLDIGNVMVGDVDARHPDTPIVKIGDLGIGKIFDQTQRQSLSYMISTRTMGKITIYTPEQNTYDWSFCDRPPILRGEPVAGNYSWWTNLYQAAAIMWQIITGCILDTPPQPSVMNVDFGGVQTMVWTYGGLVLDAQYGWHDLNLRRTIAQCMAVNPYERPTMDQLDGALRRMCSAAAWAGGAEFMADNKRSIQNLMTGPS